MKTNTQVVSKIPTGPAQLAKLIKSGKYPKQKIDITQFFRHLGNDQYVPKDGTRIQVREVDRDLDRIERAVTKMKASGDTSQLEPLTVVYFPETDEYKLLNGNHTVEMAIKMGIKHMDVYIVNFETQLESSKFQCHRLGNILNRQAVEKVDATLNDIKRELMLLMDERESQGLDPVPTMDEKKELVETYPQVSLNTVGQWISNHKDVGGRRAPKKSYTQAELDSARDTFKNMIDYKDYAVCDARTLSAWRDTGISAIFNDCMEQKKKKALVIFYCSTVGQVDQLVNNDPKRENIKKTIERKYEELSKYWKIEIKTSFMAYE